MSGGREFRFRDLEPDQRERLRAFVARAGLDPAQVADRSVVRQGEHGRELGVRVFLLNDQGSRYADLNDGNEVASERRTLPLGDELPWLTASA